MSHTPGEWEVQDDPIYVKIPHTKYGHQFIRCIDEASDVSDEEDEANARLIAAAPELLEAGQLVIDRWCQGDLAEAVRMLDAAVKKAKGEDTQEPAPRGWDKV